MAVILHCMQNRIYDMFWIAYNYYVPMYIVIRDVYFTVLSCKVVDFMIDLFIARLMVNNRKI